MRGKGSQTLSLPAFEHSVEVSLAGYNTVRRRVTPRPGLQQLVEVKLLTAQETRQASIKPQITTALGQTLLLFSPADSPLSDFTMGASRREPGRRANEVMHPVSLRRAFYLQTTEVTNAQFRQFASGHNSGQIESNSLNRDHQPAVQVSWQQAAAFCNWLSKREGLPLFYREANGIINGYNPSATGYRLPSEAEWAWARARQWRLTVEVPLGRCLPATGQLTGKLCRQYVGLRHRASIGGLHRRPCGERPCGLLQGQPDIVFSTWAAMLRNGYTMSTASPLPTAQPRLDPLGGQSGDNYVIRGASWSHSKIAELRLSYRDYGQAGRDDVGFRLARYAE